MWLSLSDSFLSIVALNAPAADRQQLLVRARVAGDIERLFPTATVTHTPKHDYAYRSTLPRSEVAAALAAAVTAVNYTNFKDSVGDPLRHAAYLRCWTAMHDLQRRKAGRAVPAGNDAASTSRLRCQTEGFVERNHARQSRFYTGRHRRSGHPA